MMQRLMAAPGILGLPKTLYVVREGTNHLGRVVDRSCTIHQLKRFDDLYLPYKDGIFDRVISSHTLDHMSENQSRALIIEMKRVLRAEGQLRVILTDFSSLWEGYKLKVLNRQRLLKGLPCQVTDKQLRYWQSEELAAFEVFLLLGVHQTRSYWDSELLATLGFREGLSSRLTLVGEFKKPSL